ncbi:MAG TPA: hypothetical protein ENJ37_08035 [Deltaproteobacteria bacterium]|nr:hypothetical protein [Deltaproteobacteria bacterium]
MKSEPLRIAFRVDADTHVGTGHLMEVMALIEAMESICAVEPLVVTRANPYTVERLERSGIRNVMLLDGGCDEEEDVIETVGILSAWGYRDLVIDLLDRSDAFYAALKERLATTTVILDNNVHKATPADLVINFSITQSACFYDPLPGCYLVGPRYAILGGAIAQRTPPGVKESVSRIFVNQGGGDPYGLTSKTLKAVDGMFEGAQVDVVVGGSLGRATLAELEETKRELGGGERYIFHSNISQQEVYDLMERADLALTAAGNTLYELSYFGVPSIVICHHPLHDTVARAFEQEGAVINLGEGNRLDEEVIACEALRVAGDLGLRKTLSRNMRRIVDGGGTARVARRIAEVVRWSRQAGPAGRGKGAAEIANF